MASVRRLSVDGSAKSGPQAPRGSQMIALRPAIGALAVLSPCRRLRLIDTVRDAVTVRRTVGSA